VWNPEGYTSYNGKIPGNYEFIGLTLIPNNIKGNLIWAMISNELKGASLTDMPEQFYGKPAMSNKWMFF